MKVCKSEAKIPEKIAFPARRPIRVLRSVIYLWKKSRFNNHMRVLGVFLGTLLLSLQGVLASSLCVTNEYANLRGGPGTDHDKTWKVFQYMPLKSYGKYRPSEGGYAWYHVEDLDGREHWVREDLVSEQIQCAVIQNEYAHLRTGPGTDYDKWKPVEKGERYLSLRVVGEKGDWVHLQDKDGDQFWIYRPLLWIP